MESKSKRKINPFSSIVRGWKRFEELPAGALRSVRNFLMILLIADLFLVIWYMDQRRVGIFLFLLIIIFLIFTLIAERRDDKMEDKTENEQKSIQKEEKEEDTFGLEGIGKEIEDMQEDMKKAVKESFEESYV